MAASVPLSALAASLELGDHELISIVGGGGKTTTLFALGEQLGGRVVLTTTTKMGRDRTGGREVLFSPMDEELLAALAEHRCVVAWGADGGHKAIGVSGEVVDGWFGIVDHVVVEADGSRRRPFKAPAPHEPVVPAATTRLVCCIGADALGRVIADQCHRPLRVAAVAECSAYDRLTPARAARVLASRRGSMKGMPAGARYDVIITRSNASDADLVGELLGALKAEGITGLIADQD